MALAEQPLAVETAETAFPSFDPDELTEELSSALAEAGAPPTEGRPRQDWQIENEAAADWAMRKLQVLHRRRQGARDAADAQIQALTAVAQHRVDQILTRLDQLRRPIVEWLEEVEGKLEPEVRFFEDLLERFHLKLLESDPKRKTLRLPHGSIEARKQPDEWRYENEQLFLDYARASKPELIRVTEAPVKDAVKKTFVLAPAPNEDGSYDVVDPTTGDIVPGLSVVVGGQKVTVKPMDLDLFG